MLFRLVPAAAVSTAAHAAAARPTADFRYLRDEGALGCPNEAAVRAAISARLGYDPFEKGAPRTIRASIETLSDGFVARVELEGGPDGRMQRELVTHGSCSELVSAMALSISLAIDAENAPNAPAPESTTSPAPEAAAVTPEEPTAAPPAARVKTPVEATQPELKASRNETLLADEPARALPRPKRNAPHIALPLDFALGTHLQLGFGSAPSTSVGAALFAQLRGRAFSLGLEFRADAPAGQSLAGGGRVESGIRAFELVPCLHYSWVRGCAVALGGEVWGRARDLAVSRTDFAFYAAGGARVGVEWPQNRAWALSAHADLLAPFTPISMRVDGRSVWIAPDVFATLGVGGLLRF